MARLNRLASLAFVAGAALALPTLASAQKIVVNELYRGGNLESTDEYLELLVVEDLTAAELNTFLYGDSTSSTASKFGAYQFTGMENIAAIFPAGTIIVMGGATAPFVEDTSFDPDNGDWNIELIFGSARITKVGSLGDYAGTDVAWVDTAASGDTISADGFAVNWDSTPGTFGGNANVTVAVPANNTNLFVSGPSHTEPDDWSSGGTLTHGEPNGGENTAYIETLREGDVLLIELESFSASADHAGAPVNIEWATASEIDSVGFNVRRASAEDGGLVPGGLVNNALIPAQGSGGSGASYSLVDPVAVGADERRAYFLIEVDANGTRTPYGPFRARVGDSPSAVSEWVTY